MGDLLDRGAAFLDAQRHQHLSRPVLYRRGTDEKEVHATVGKTEYMKVPHIHIETWLDSGVNRQVDPASVWPFLKG